MGGVLPLFSRLPLHSVARVPVNFTIAIHHSWTKAKKGGRENDDGECWVSHRLCTHACDVQPAARLIPMLTRTNRTPTIWFNFYNWLSYASQLCAALNPECEFVECNIIVYNIATIFSTTLFYKGKVKCLVKWSSSELKSKRCRTTCSETRGINNIVTDSCNPFKHFFSKKWLFNRTRWWGNNQSTTTIVEAIE